MTDENNILQRDRASRGQGMIYTELTKKAMKLCFAAHKEQVDKSGLPYVHHPFHLAEQMTDEDSTVVALLHDVVEDTEYTLDDLRDMGFPRRITDAIALLTHDKSVPYMEYVRSIGENPLARTVKLADLRHNSDLTRLDAVTDADLKRVQKYWDAIRLLEYSGVRGQMHYAWLLPCCETIIQAGRNYCPKCGKRIEEPKLIFGAEFDPDETVWICSCGGDEAVRHRYCSRCGRKRPF